MDPRANRTDSTASMKGLETNLLVMQILPMALALSLPSKRLPSCIEFIQATSTARQAADEYQGELTAADSKAGGAAPAAAP